ncbi:MAG: protocatechuate 3,4-dioxygenase [Acidimicrobiales bacterium]
MAEIVAGLGCSHAPSIAHVYDRGKTREPDWRPLFDCFDLAERWLRDARPDVLVCIYNDHIDQFFLDAWPTFSVGIGPCFEIADEGWAPRALPSVPGHPKLARHIASELVRQGIDVTVSHRQVVDHGILSPLPLIDTGWAFPVVPLGVNVIWDPCPTPARCAQMGRALGKAIETFDATTRVAVVGTGGLSHQLSGKDFGVLKPDWDLEFMRLLGEDPEQLNAYSMDDLAAKGGEHSIEVVQWMAMRSALPACFRTDFAFYYPHQIMGYGMMGFCPPPPTAKN